MEGYLNFLNVNEDHLKKSKTTLICLEMEDDLNAFENGRRP